MSRMGRVDMFTREKLSGVDDVVVAFEAVVTVEVFKFVLLLVDDILVSRFCFFFGVVYYELIWSWLFFYFILF